MLIINLLDINRKTTQQNKDEGEDEKLLLFVRNERSMKKTQLSKSILHSIDRQPCASCCTKEHAQTHTDTHAHKYTCIKLKKMSMFGGGDFKNSSCSHLFVLMNQDDDACFHNESNPVYFFRTSQGF